MPISYRFLRSEHLPQVHHTFVGAFADYAVDMSYLSEERLLNRAIKNGISFESSVGAYDGDEMVGFTLVGLDCREEVSSAFDIATGVLPSHQGRGVAKAMLAHALPHLRDRGVQRFMLEVIQENEAAIRAYRATGFEIRRELDCYELSLDEKARSATGKRVVGSVSAPSDMVADAPVQAAPESARQVVVREISRDLLPRFERDLDWQPSWENGITSILRIPDEVVVCGASRQGGESDQLAGAIVYYPALNWVLNLVVRRASRRQGVGTFLMRHLIDRICAEVPSVRILNIDHEDYGMIVFLERIGFRVYVSQYEMELVL